MQDLIFRQSTCLLQSLEGKFRPLHLNGMLHHSLGGEKKISLHHFIDPAPNLMHCLQAQGTRDCNKGIKLDRNFDFFPK